MARWLSPGSGSPRPSNGAPTAPEPTRFRVCIGSARRNDWDVRVDLHRGGALCATLLFMKAGRALPRNSTSEGIARLHFGIAHYPAVIYLLSDGQSLDVTLDDDEEPATSHPEPAGQPGTRPRMTPKHRALESGDRGSI